MGDGKVVIIEALKKHRQDAIRKAWELRHLASKQPTEEEAALYLQQAKEEEAKAEGYLTHAEILAKMDF